LTEDRMQGSGKPDGINWLKGSVFESGQAAAITWFGKRSNEVVRTITHPLAQFFHFFQNGCTSAPGQDCRVKSDNFPVTWIVKAVGNCNWIGRDKVWLFEPVDESVQIRF